MMKLNRLTIFTLIVGLVLVMASNVMAQESLVNSLTLSEATINETLQQNSPDPNTDLSVDFQTGQLVINLVATGPRGNTSEFALILVPSVNPNGSLQIDATKLTLNGFEIPINNNPAVDSTIDTVNGFLQEEINSGQIQDVVVTEDRLMISWLNNDPNAPIVNIRDTLLSLTFTESSINQMDWVTNPAGAYVSAINVDLQPGQGVINVTRTTDPTSIAYEIRPIIVNERVAWQVNAQADLETSLTHTLQTIWRAYIGGVLGNGSMVSATVTDDTVQFTWDLANEIQPSEAVVDYTISEADINAALTAFTSEELSNIFIDMQTDKLIVSASGVGEDGTPFAVSITLVPTFANGDVTWRATSLTFNGVTIDNPSLDTNEAVIDSLTRELRNNRNNGTVTAFNMTDTEISFTIQYR